MRLDEDKLDALRRWGDALQRSDGEEHAAAGRAILMLVEEIDQLQIELSHARQQASRAMPVTGEDPAGDGDKEPALTLHERLQQTVEDSQEASSAMIDDKTADSPQSWLESLRRRT